MFKVRAGQLAPHWPRGVDAVTVQALGPAAREPVDSRLRSSPGHCPLSVSAGCSGPQGRPRIGLAREAGRRVRFPSASATDRALTQRVCDEDGSQPVRPEPRPRARITS
jgi:hypothetical protein